MPGASLDALGAAAHQLVDDMEDQQVGRRLGCRRPARVRAACSRTLAPCPPAGQVVADRALLARSVEAFRQRLAGLPDSAPAPSAPPEPRAAPKGTEVDA